MPRPLHTAMVESFKVVTAFTVAHSITLTLAALGVVALAPQSRRGVDCGHGVRDRRVGVLEAHAVSWLAAWPPRSGWFTGLGLPGRSRT